MSGIEGMGEAITGGLAARVVEPQAGEGGAAVGGEGTHGGGAGDGAEGRACLNCGTLLAGDYCQGCGQQAHVHRTLGAFWHDLLHGVLHFEGKTWRTLPLLAWWPGDLTRRYVEGERAKFVSPLALFLFAVFLMFAAVSTIGGPFGGAEGSTGAELAAERQDLADKVARLTKEREALAAKGGDTSKIDEQIEDTRQELGVLNVLNGDSPGRAGGTLPGPTAGVEQPGEAAQAGGAAAANASAGDPAGGAAKPGPSNWFFAAVAKAKENPALMLYKLQNNAYKFSWALIPISIPFVWLLFLHRRRYRQYKAYDHAIFVTYSIAFMTLLTVVLSVARAMGVGVGWIFTALTFAPLVHMYRQLRGAYRLGAWSAIWRTFVLSQFAIFAATLFMLLLLVIGAA